MRWIPIKERLPESDEKVLITQSLPGDEGCVSLARYYETENKFYANRIPLENVIAWQPVYPFRTIFKRPENESFVHAAEMFVECQLNANCDDCLFKKECTYNTESHIEGPNKRMALILNDILDKSDKLSDLTTDEFEELLS